MKYNLLLYFLLYLCCMARANVLVVVPLSRLPLAYDVNMDAGRISIYESVSQNRLLDYAVPFGCHTSRANIYQKGHNLVFEIPCSYSVAVL